MDDWSLPKPRLALLLEHFAAIENVREPWGVGFGGPGATLAFSAAQINRCRTGPRSAPSCLRPHVP